LSAHVSTAAKLNPSAAVVQASPPASTLQFCVTGGGANIALARKFLGVIYHTLKNDWVFASLPP
jgi:hypothetical protein